MKPEVVKEAAQKQEEAFESFIQAKERVAQASAILDQAQSKVESAKSVLLREYDQMMANNARYQDVWSKYDILHIETEKRIQSLRVEQERLQKKARKYQHKADSCVEYGNSDYSKKCAEKAREYSIRAKDINHEISALKQQIADAKESARLSAPGTNSLFFHLAKDTFESAKAEYALRKTELFIEVEEKNRLWQEFDIARKEYYRIKNEM